MNRKKKEMNKKKVIGLLILLAIYVASYFAGFGLFIVLPADMNIIIKLLLADILATVVIWLFGVFLNTASIYDPYWSVQTPVIYLSLMIYYGNYNFGTVLFFIFIMLWAIRLTVNFIITFNDIRYCDWRYTDLKNKTGKLYQIVNLLGINMMPTLLVFLASIPSFIYVINGCDFEAINIIGYVVILIAVGLEFTSDVSIHKFKKIRQSRSEIINIGLWKYSRHPNYLGEILFWYGVLFVFLFNNFNYWYVIFGAILINMLFLFISIPLAEKKLVGYKEGYEDYKQRTRKLLPIPVRTKD